MADENKYVMKFADFGNQSKQEQKPNAEIGEDYEMNLDADDFVGEHARWIVGAAMDATRDDDKEVDLQAAFNKLVDDYSLNDEPDDDRQEQVKDSLIEFIGKLAEQAKNISVKNFGGSKPPTV